MFALGPLKSDELKVEFDLKQVLTYNYDHVILILGKDNKKQEAKNTIRLYMERSP